MPGRGQIDGAEQFYDRMASGLSESDLQVDSTFPVDRKTHENQLIRAFFRKP
jgi:hypothetical protein